jgi:hypothetical protein
MVQMNFSFYEEKVPKANKCGELFIRRQAAEIASGTCKYY